MSRLPLLAGVAAGLFLCGTAQALSIYIPPLPERVANARAIIVGTVTAIEKEPVIAPAGPKSEQKIRFQVAVVKVDENLLGAKGLTDLRVGFVPPPAPAPVGGNNGLPEIPYVGPPELKVGMTALFVLAAHPGETFYTARGVRDVLVKAGDAKEFTVELKQARHLASLLADPRAGLTAKDANARFLTGGMLICRYRNFGVRGGEAPPKTVPIDAEENKLILAALRGADWAAQRPDNFTPEHVFLRLPLTAKEGWTRPRDYKQIPAAARAWLEKHKDTYRIEKLAEQQP
ncbi:MAG: hypothetical protein AB7K24_03585 [Gemmataceae bacterium]